MWEHVHTTLVIPVAGKGEKIESQHENSGVLLPTSPPPLADMAQALFLRMFMRLEGGGGSGKCPQCKLTYMCNNTTLTCASAFILRTFVWRYE